MTKQMISTVSYNTVPFLDKVLKDLYKKHIIQAYVYIFHKGEDGDKDHIHLIIYPNRQIDVMDLTEMLKEPDITRIDNKPLGVRPWRVVAKNSEADWYLYSLHDKEYLKLKYGEGEPHEKIPYSIENFVYSEGFDIESAVIRAKSTMIHNPANMAKRIVQGERPLDLILSGENVHTVNAIRQAMVIDDYSRLQSQVKDFGEKILLFEKWAKYYGYTIDDIIEESKNLYTKSLHE